MKYQLRKEGQHVDLVADTREEADVLIAKGWVLVRIIGWLR